MIAPREPSAPGAASVVNLSDQIFMEGGHLQQAMGLEHRPAQESLARACARAFAENHPLIFEAGTGVGKSLGYLLPGLLRAVETKRPFLVSTHTIALQQQIYNQDLLICRELFTTVPGLAKFRDFQVALMVGRGNYLCGHRLRRAMRGQTELFDSAGGLELERIAHWAAETKDGLREEMQPPPDPRVWDWVNADSSSCNRRNCNPDTCFFRKALAERAKANILILNHSLLFSLLGAGLSPSGGQAGILYANDFLVLDEAHTIADVATRHFGLSLSSYGLDRLLKALYNPKTRKGMLARLGGETERGLITGLIRDSAAFFQRLANHHLHGLTSRRLRQPDWSDFAIGPSLRELVSGLRSLRDEPVARAVKDELGDQIERLNAYRLGLQESLALEKADHVYWLEKGGRNGRIVTVCSAPLDVAPYLKKCLFERQTGLLLTSATLATGASMAPFQERTGGTGQRCEIAASPFDYRRNMAVFIAADAPIPTASTSRLNIAYLVDAIDFCVSRVAGGTLVLFTAYGDLRTVYEQLLPRMQAAGRDLLAQGMELSRAGLKKRFGQAGNGVLLGTDSFWTGFDMPGPALSQVILTRLPFENPTQPIAEAKCEWIRDHGGNPFHALTLPDALLKFRQGVGRLIRKQSDRGIITLLDSRILRKPYGKLFLDALPDARVEYFTRDDREEVFPYLSD